MYNTIHTWNNYVVTTGKLELCIIQWFKENICKYLATFIPEQTLNT